MSVTTGQQLKDLGGGLFSAVSSTEKTRVTAALVRRIVVCPLADVVADTAALAEKVVFSVPATLVNGIKVISCTITATEGITAHDDNHRTFTLKKYDAAGANGTTVGAVSTDSNATPVGTSLTAFVPKSLILKDSATTVVASACLTFQGTGAGTEENLAGAVCTIEYEEL